MTAHDLPRLHTEFPEAGPRRLLQALQFTLPGAPNLYYGVEVGMEGGPDPANRGPMRWDRVQANHPELAWVRQLIALRREHRALRVGDFRSVESQRLFAFERHTDRVLETVVVLVLGYYFGSSRGSARPGGGVQVQPAGPAFRVESEPARAATLCRGGTAS